MSELINMGASVLGGGVTGIVGTIFGRVAGYFEKKQANKHEIKLREFQREENLHDLTVMEREFAHEENLHNMNMQANAQAAEHESLVISQKGSWDGLKASIEAQSSIKGTSVWVNNVVRLVRPVLTLSLWVLVVVLEKMSADADTIEAALFAATAATLWWFGDRGAHHVMKKKEA